MDHIRLDRSDAAYPTALNYYLGKDAPLSVAALGKLEILAHNKLALFCSAPNENLITLGARPLAPGEEVEITLRSLERS